MEGRDGVGGAELVDEAKTDAQRDDRGDDRRVRRIPVSPETAAAASSSRSRGLRSWRTRIAMADTRRTASAFGPNARRRACGFGLR